MRTLVFGAKGQLGRDLILVFRSAGETVGYDLPEVDISDETALQPLIKEFAPDLVINAAAYTDVEGAEDNLREVFLANETGARNVAELAAFHHVPVVYYSTDYVFDGVKGLPYAPDDPVAPLGVYGKSKAAGETATRKANPYHFVIRTAWLYGPGGNNFVEKIVRAAHNGNPLRVVDDELGSPTYTRDVAEATLALARTKAYGTHHVVNAGYCSRFAFAREIVRIAELHVEVVPCRSGEYPTRAPRPKYSVLDASALADTANYQMRSWQKALLAYMQERHDAFRPNRSSAADVPPTSGDAPAEGHA